MTTYSVDEYFKVPLKMCTVHGCYKLLINDAFCEIHSRKLISNSTLLSPFVRRFYV